MRTIILVLALVGCAAHAPLAPVAPAPVAAVAPPANLAIMFATHLDQESKCTAEATALPATLDSAQCRLGGIVYRCTAGVNAKPACGPIADTHPPEPQPAPASPPVTAKPAPVKATKP